MDVLVASILALWAIAPVPAASRYMFVEDVTLCVCITRGPWFVVGHLDSQGEFTETHRVSSNGHIGGGVRIGVLLNGSPLAGTPLYELRSDVLVPGTFDKDGYFVPEVGGKIIKFSDYRYGPDAPRIWNLPGRFLTLEDARKLPPKPVSKPADKAIDPGYNFSNCLNK